MTPTRPETDAEAKTRPPAPESALRRRALSFTFTDWAAI
jgi:hypothetical protein